MTKVVNLNNVVNLKKVRKQKRKDRARGITFCRSGHHRWEVVKDSVFDVKQGGLVTVRRCARCGETRTTLDGGR